MYMPPISPVRRGKGTEGNKIRGIFCAEMRSEAKFIVKELGKPNRAPIKDLQKGLFFSPPLLPAKQISLLFLSKASFEVNLTAGDFLNTSI